MWRRFFTLLFITEIAGGIIGDGDCKRTPFPVLGLSLWFGTIFLFLEHIAPSLVVHAHTCCDFCGCSGGKMASKIPEIFDAFLAQLNTFISIAGILLQYFRRKLLQFEWSKTVSNSVMSRFIALSKLFLQEFTILHSKRQTETFEDENSF